jgi:serine/threonine protein kinase
VRKKTTGALYAMKVINKKHILDSDKVEQIIAERKIFSMLDHPFIVQLHWAFTSVRFNIIAIVYIYLPF